VHAPVGSPTAIADPTRSLLDMCRDLKTRPDADLYLGTWENRAARQAKPTVYLHGQPLHLFDVLGKGANGSVRVARLGTRRGADGTDLVVKFNRADKSSRAGDAAEARVQALLFCYMRHARARWAHVNESTAHPIRIMAKIPKPYFLMESAALGRGLGMEPLDATLKQHLLGAADGRAARAALHGVLRQVALLLEFLHEEMRFVHGDLHGSNVMLRGRVAYVIDFGMSSFTGPDGKRVRAHARYAETGFTPYLALLMLITYLTDTLARHEHTRLAAESCWAIVGRFWLRVRDRVEERDFRGKNLGPVAHRLHALLADDAPPKFAHHLLYQRATRVVHTPTQPRELIEYLDERATREREDGIGLPPLHPDGVVATLFPDAHE